jgi:hypothetical protein
MGFPKIDDFFLITFYNFYGEVFYSFGTRAGTKTVSFYYTTAASLYLIFVSQRSGGRLMEVLAN